MIKKLLVLLLVAGMILNLAACNPKDDQPTTGGETEEKKNTQEEKAEQKTSPEELKGFNEAPMLAEMVKAGELPAVEERLPVKEDIMIEPVQDKIGQHGGDLRMPWKGLKDKWRVEKFTEEALFRFNEDGSDVEPNVAKGYDVNEDSTEYTIYLREGMKWSDGAPFTADDAVFYYNEIILTKANTKDPRSCYYSVDPETGERVLAEVTKVDDYAFKVKFAHPSVMFLKRLAIDDKWLYAPKHYYEDKLPHLIGDEKAMEIAKEMGYEDLKAYKKWTVYYYWMIEGRPTVRPWIIANDPNEEVVTFKRNPYYFKTDAEGNQLPYVDSFVMQRVENTSQYELEGIAGNVDLLPYDAASFTLLKENESAGDYKVNLYPRMSWASKAIQLNLTVEDPNLRELFRDIRFREALSLAVDRQEVADLAYNGIVEPTQASVPEGLANHREGWNEQWIEFDQERAKQLLDEIGLPVGADGFRTFKDGSDFVFVIYKQSDNSEIEKAEELFKFYFEQIGIKTTMKLIERSYFEELVQSNEMTAASHPIGLFNVALRPDEIVPTRVGLPWAGHLGLYFDTNGEQGVKPEGDIAKLLENWNGIVSAKSNEEIEQYADNIMELHQKNQWFIGYTSADPVPILVKNNVKNVPAKMIYGDEFRDMGHMKPAQIFIEK